MQHGDKLVSDQYPLITVDVVLEQVSQHYNLGISGGWVDCGVFEEAQVATDLVKATACGEDDHASAREVLRAHLDREGVRHVRIHVGRG